MVSLPADYAGHYEFSALQESVPEHLESCSLCTKLDKEWKYP